MDENLQKIDFLQFNINLWKLYFPDLCNNRYDGFSTECCNTKKQNNIARKLRVRSKTKIKTSNERNHQINFHTSLKTARSTIKGGNLQFLS